MKRKRLSLLIAISIATGNMSAGINLFKKKVQPTIANTEAKKDSTANDKKAAYSKLLKGAQLKKGLFVTHLTKDGKLYLELPDSIFSETYLLSNRIAQTSNSQDFVAGQMATNPILIRFSKNDNNVFLHSVQHRNIVAENDPITPSFTNNFADPVLKSFKIAATNGSNVVIDVTAFFTSNEKCISPIKPDPTPSPQSLKASIVGEASYISEIKTFPMNVEIKSSLSFSTERDPYTVTVHRSILRLPKEPMRMRRQDNRVGFFNSNKVLFTTEQDRVIPFTFIHRWRLEPKAEDSVKYFRGELVEPVKPIVFYVDSAFPAKWRETIKQGIEDWNTAFEAAGFKNAIHAKDYPKNDPTFDPEDMRYSCVKYAVTSTANAMGPSHIDPRSGEILTGDVIWYHNILSLLHNWRFVQTGAVDARVRKSVFDDDVMSESIRYAAAHEIGHTIGLMHNMGASYSIPVDSLRSPSFTKKFGTTPSIMDYARNNYVAQPGDLEKGVKLTPPVLGVYDIYAIKWGYRLVENAKSMEDEIKTSSSWIKEKQHDRMYEFGAQQFMGTIDPTAQTEDLGNDHIKANSYGIKNLQVIMKNLEAWTFDKGETFNYTADMYKEVVTQYKRFIGHVFPYIGGIRFKEIRQGEKGVAREYAEKAEQKRALEWLLNEVRSYDAWLTPAALMQRLGLDMTTNNGIQLSVVQKLLDPGALYRIAEGEKVDPVNCYKLNDYIDDVYNLIFRASIKGQPLNETEINLQTTALSVMTQSSGLNKASASSKSLALSAEAAYNEFVKIGNTPALPCSQSCEHELEGDNSFLRVNYGTPTLSSTISAPMMTAQLKRVLALYKQRAISGDARTRDFYKYQILTLEKLFKN